MKKKMAIALCAGFLCCFSAFADVGLYVKGALGYGMDLGAASFNGSVHSFKAKPAFGVFPWLNSGNAFLKGLSFEAQVNLGLANGRTRIMPGVMAIYNWQTAGRLATHYGLGASVPILVLEGQPYAGFAVNLLLGLGFAVTEKIMPIFEFEAIAGAASNYSALGMDLRAGIVYKF